MASCSQYNTDYIDSVNRSTISLNIGFVQNIIAQDDSDYIDSEDVPATKVTGVWYPIVIKASDNEAEYCDLLQKSKSTSNTFDKYYSYAYGKDKCQSSDVGSFDILNISDNLVATKTRFFDTEDATYTYNALDCSYCGSYYQEWQLIDEEGNKSQKTYNADCCGGACDVRMNENDYTPKIPLLNHHYYTEPCDFQYIGDNPARSGPGLGKEACVTSTEVRGLTFAGDVKFCIDWKLKETISEIPYDENTTQHANKNLHDKSYKKSRIVSNTCGNFLLTSINEDTKYDGYNYDWLEDNLQSVPEPELFTKPYGMKDSTINNIFIGTKKIGSFWKWNYTSGILGWYRKYDTKRINDQRPIRGIDLYIANGDVFYATNAAIEPDPPSEPEEPEASADTPFIKPCPSGLKIVNNASFKGIIPNESSFTYISANIYDLFYEWYERYINAGNSVSESKRLAAIMATAPQFENVTTDLLDPVLGAANSSTYSLDSLKQIKILSENLQTGTNYDSARINYVANKQDLMDVLSSKYGFYLSIKNNSSITFNNTVSDNFVLDINFDFVTKANNGSPSYSENIKVDGEDFLTANQNTLSVNGISYTKNTEDYILRDIYPRIVDADNFDSVARFNEGYCGDCDAYSSFYLTDDGEAACIQDGEASFCYATLAFFLNNSQGEEEGTRPQRNISDATLREDREVVFYHPYVDIFAINSKASMYVSSAMHDVPIGITHPDSRKCTNNSTLSLTFAPDSSSMIKLYWSTLKQVQNPQCVSNERFPLDLNSLCLCYDNNAYVPNVSTNISPRLSKYGGYSQAKLDSIFGSGLVTAGGVISSCERSDPLDGSNCIKQGSISIPNYVHSIWDLNITNGSADFVSVNENIDTTVSPWKLDTRLDYVKYNPRQEWKRFATKVKIENKIQNYIFQNSEISLYSQQERNMPLDSQNQGYEITLTNPFLTGLIGDEEFIQDINMPEGVNCTNYQGLSGLTDIRGDEISVVNLTFTSRPQKTLLNFYFDSLNTLGTGQLQSGQFHPNSGLMTGPTTFNPIVGDNLFDYDKELNLSEPTNVDIDIYYGDINDNFETIFRNLTDFQTDKKVKIYTQNNNNWYTTSLNRGTGFFEHLDYKFPGRPNIFEYIDYEYKSSLYPSVLPSVSKTHKWFDADLIDGSQYPYLERASAEPEVGYDPRIIRFEGSRYYFQIFPSIVKVTFALSEEDENGEEQLLEAGTLEDLLDGTIAGYYLPGESSGNQDEPRTNYDLLLQNNYFIQVGDDTYKKIRTGFDASSFFKLENQLEERLFMSYNDAKIDLQATEETGYVLNSSALCDTSIHCTYRTNNGIKATIANKILRKTLKWKFYDQDGFETNKSNAVTAKLYTYFFLEKSLEGKTKALRVRFSGSSFIIYDETPGLYQESSRYLNNTAFKTKWGDIIGYDNLILDEFKNDKEFVLDFLYEPVYKNWFYKHFVNYLLRDGGEKLFFISRYADSDPVMHRLGSVDAMGTILQKYNLVNSLYNQNIVLKDLKNYQNFIPVMDISLKRSINITDATSLSFTSSSLITSYYSDSALDPVDKFWFKVPISIASTRSYVPNNDYSPTLRIDGPFNQLYKTRRVWDYKGAGYHARFFPSIPLITQLSDTPGSKVSDNESFKDFIVYGDKDVPKCEAQVNEDKRGFCLLDNIGSGLLYADYVYDNRYGYARPADLSNKKYLFSYDCGEYNPVGLPQLVTIKKSKLPDDSYTRPLKDDDTQYLKPYPVIPHVNDSRYQEDMENYLVSNDAQDDNANEMLFRILYGANSNLNREFFGDSFIQPLNKIDLINYSDPEITPRDLYDQILYNYDKDTSFSNFAFDATVRVESVLDIGFEYTLKINNQNLTIKIEEDTEKNIIEAIINFQGVEKDRKTLFETVSLSHSYISVEHGESAPSPPDENTQIELVKTVKYMPTRTLRTIAARYRTGKVAIKPSVGIYARGMQVNCVDIDPEIIGDRSYGAWSNTDYSNPNLYSNRTYVEGAKTITHNYYVTKTSINNLLEEPPSDAGMQGKLNLIPGPWVWSEKFTTPETPPPPADPELSYGYCRRNLDCDEEGDDSQSIKENFTYDYEIGRNKFQLYGHAYLHTPLVVDDDDDDDADDDALPPATCFNNAPNTNWGRCEDTLPVGGNATELSTPYGRVYYEMQQPRFDGGWKYPAKGPLDGLVNVRGDFVHCYEPQEYIDPNGAYLEVECKPFADDTKWGLGYAIWKPLYGNYYPYGERWVTGILHLQTLDPSTSEFWDFWYENDQYIGDSQNPYHFNNSICADGATLAFFESMQHFPVYITRLPLTDDQKDLVLNQLENIYYNIAEWILENGTLEADRGMAMNYGHEGVDYCGYIDSSIKLKDIDIYYKTVSEAMEYIPADLIDINITDSDITVQIQNQTICIDNALSKCPNISLPDTDNSTYTINDSGCDKCDNSSLKITLNSQPSYKTISTSERYVIGYLEGTDLNSAKVNLHAVGFVNQSYHSSRHRYYDPGDGWFDVVCGETPGNPWYSHQYIVERDGMGLFDTRKNVWRQALNDLFNQDNYADTMSEPSRNYWGTMNLNTEDIAKVRRTKRANLHIKESDILHGVVPGSVSELQFREVNTNYDKFRRTDGLNIETGQGVYTKLEAYVTYTYVRPYLIKDAIKESRLGVTDNSFVNRAFDLNFPLWYGQSLGISAVTENALNNPRTKNYINTGFKFESSDDTCHSFECNYNTYANSIFYRGSPCPTEDHYCWSISTWNGAR